MYEKRKAYSEVYRLRRTNSCETAENSIVNEPETTTKKILLKCIWFTL